MESLELRVESAKWRVQSVPKRSSPSLAGRVGVGILPCGEGSGWGFHPALLIFVAGLPADCDFEIASPSPCGEGSGVGTLYFLLLRVIKYAIKSTTRSPAIHTIVIANADIVLRF